MSESSFLVFFFYSYLWKAAFHEFLKAIVQIFVESYKLWFCVIVKSSGLKIEFVKTNNYGFSPSEVELREQQILWVQLGRFAPDW